jgi:hypothetical protein
VSRANQIGIAVVVAVLVLIFGARALKDRHQASAGEVIPALRSLAYRYEWRRAPRPPGVEGVLAGRAIDRHGVALNFVVAVYDGPTYEQQSPRKPLPVVAMLHSAAAAAATTR